MNKLFSTIFVFFFFSTFANATGFEDFTKQPNQLTKSSSMEFMHSGGAGFVAVSDAFTSISGWAGAYTPRYGMTTSKYSSFGVSSPILLALSFNSQSGASGVVDLPLMAEYSFGYGATHKADRKGFGMYFGAGAGLTLISGGFGYGGTFSNWNVAGGARFEIQDNPVDLRITYGKGFGDWSEVNKFTLGISYILTYI